MFRKNAKKEFVEICNNKPIKETIIKTIVLFEDGSWAELVEHGGCGGENARDEWWEIKKYPEIPESLKQE